MTTAALSDVPMSLLLDGTAAPSDEREALAAALEPYARWHRFIVDSGVVTSVAQFLLQPVTPPWSRDRR